MRRYKIFRGKVTKVIVENEEIKRPTENEPIGEDRVIGVDTETLSSQDGLVTVLLPFADDQGTHVQEEFLKPEDSNPIELLFAYLIARFGVDPADGRKGRGKSRRARVRYRPKKGTIETLVPVLLVFYNMEYDLQRLFLSMSAFFRMTELAKDGRWVTVGKYEVQMIMTSPSGSAPYFHWIVFDAESEKAVRLYGIDMWGYWKSGLNKTAKSLGIGSKIDIQKDWFQTPLEEYTQDMINEMIRYAGEDARLTREVYLATARLLGSLSKAVFRRNGILPPSAPAAAARLAFSMMDADSFPRPPKQFEQLALDAYHGGYVACIRRGWVEGATVADLHSAYPSAMCLLPDPCTVEYILIESDTWTDIPEEIRAAGCLGFVSATFVVFPDRFPGISKSHPEHTLHQPGVYERFAISLPELSVMMDLGQVKMARIHHGFYLFGDSETSFFRRFVLHFYEMKETEEREGRKDSPKYLASKLLMNSLYGKLIEVNEPKKPVLPREYELATIYYDPKLQGKTNRRNFQQAYIDGGIEAVMELSRKNREKWGNEEPKAVSFADVLPKGPNRAGYFFLPIYASLITAMTRAKIATMLNLFKAFAGDTDSIFTTMRPGTEEWKKAEKAADWICRRAGVGPVKDDPGLGGYGIEMIDGRGYVAGLKQYFLVSKNPQSPKKMKLAYHAVANADRLTTRLAVARLARGQEKTYQTKPKPRRFRESLMKQDGQFGIFVRQWRQVTPKHDERMRVKNYIPDRRHPVWEYEWRDLNEVEKSNDEISPGNET